LRQLYETPYANDSLRANATIVFQPTLQGFRPT